MGDHKDSPLHITVPGLPGAVCIGAKPSSKPGHVAFIFSSLMINRAVDVEAGAALAFAYDIERAVKKAAP